MKKLLIFLSVLFTLGFFSSTALAVPVTFTSHNSHWVQIHFNGQSQTVAAGYYNIEIDNEYFKSFCLDLYDHAPPIGETIHDYEYVPLTNVPDGIDGGMGQDRANRLYGLWTQYNTGFSNIQAAGFQIAVWHIIFGSDQTLNSSGNTFTVSRAFATDMGVHNSIIDSANAYLNEINWDQVYNPNIAAVTHTRYQDFAAPVPEPATLLLFGTSLLGLLFFGRKRLFTK